jgi:tetratricopeptide (TPR) repeat protein
MSALLKLDRIDELREAMAASAAEAESWTDPEARAGSQTFIAGLRENLGEPQEALAAVSQAIDMSPELLEAIFLRAGIRRRNNDEQGAEEDCDSAARIVLDPAREPGIRLESYQLGPDCNRWVQAFEGLDRLVQDFPRWYEAYQARAIANFRLGRLEAALWDLGKVIEYAPQYWRGYHNRAALRFKMRLPDNGDSDRAIELNPYNVGLLRNRAMNAFQAGDLREALADVERVLDLNPRFGPGYTERARQLAYQGRCDEVRRALERARELTKTDPNPRSIRANIVEAQVQAVFYGCPELFDPVAVIEDAEFDFDPNEGDPESWTTYGTALYRAARYEEARDALLKAIEMVGAESPYDQFILSMVSSQLADRRQARMHYDRAVAAMDQNGSDNPIWINYRDEASRLLGIE